MLALKSYEQTTGFSVLNTDELFFINGGSAIGGNPTPTPPTPTPPTTPKITISGISVTISVPPAITINFDVK